MLLKISGKKRKKAKNKSEKLIIMMKKYAVKVERCFLYSFFTHLISVKTAVCRIS